MGGPIYWRIRRRRFLAEVNLAELGTLPVANVRKLLKLARTAECSPELEELPALLAECLTEARAHVKYVESCPPEELLSSWENRQPERYRKAARNRYIKEAQQKAKGLERVLEIMKGFIYG